ncbi:MAG: AraC family transcriptional regulator [Burkholderiales bacterium]
MDALSELLRVVKLSGAMFFDVHCGAPWCVRSPPARAFGRYVAPHANHLIEFHLIAEGRAWIRVGTETTPLAAGDIVMVPHGDEHYLGNGLGAQTIDGEASLPLLLRRELLSSRLGTDDGEKTRFICGYLACEAGLVRPVLSCLPHVVRVPIRADSYGALLENMIRHAVEQAASALPGSGVIVARLAEVLFAEVLRRYLLQLPPGRSGWLAGAADAVVGRALEALHRQPGREWTLDVLAQEVGISRSALTERFARYLGQGPMTYLTDWRLELAAESLRTTSRSVLQIAGEVGYESEAAFNRAFKRRFDRPPAAYRRSQRS